eukprot:scaffold168907_cov34-Prasinocladus_malaysianus.AAC.1
MCFNRSVKEKLSLGLCFPRLVDSYCPIEINAALEEECQNELTFRKNSDCLTDPGLPHSQFLNKTQQRLVRGYSAIFRRVLPYLQQKGWTGYNVVNWDAQKFNASRDSDDLTHWPALLDADIIISTMEQFRFMHKLIFYSHACIEAKHLRGVNAKVIGD